LTTAPSNSSARGSGIGVRFRREGRGGNATVVIDGAQCGSVEFPFVMSIISNIDPSVGYDHGSPVSPRYTAPFAFAGTLHQVDIQLVTQSTDPQAAAAQARETMSRQ
jgi:arylsulfatase